MYIATLTRSTPRRVLWYLWSHTSRTRVKFRTQVRPIACIAAKRWSHLLVYFLVINILCVIIWYVKLLIRLPTKTLKVFIQQILLLWCFYKIRLWHDSHEFGHSWRLQDISHAHSHAHNDLNTQVSVIWRKWMKLNNFPCVESTWDFKQADPIPRNCFVPVYQVIYYFQRTPNPLK